MPAIVRKPLSSTIAQSFVNSFTLSPSEGESIYIALGKVTSWQPDDQNPLASDSNPVLPLDYDTEAIELKRNISFHNSKPPLSVFAPTPKNLAI